MIMKKLPIIISVLLLTLTSCNNKPSETIDPEQVDEEYVLERDKSENYVIDSSVSNENGSMSYEIFTRSFYDTNNDGIGDLNGVKVKLPYLKDLGIKTVWLMPIMPSPSYHGYDVSDYYNVHKDIGTMSDFEALISEANKYNIDIMLDMVFNHCSTKNPYFEQSYNDYINENDAEDSKANWFNWRHFRH